MNHLIIILSIVLLVQTFWAGSYLGSEIQFSENSFKLWLIVIAIMLFGVLVIPVGILFGLCKAIDKYFSISFTVKYVLLKTPIDTSDSAVREFQKHWIEKTKKHVKWYQFNKKIENYWVLWIDKTYFYGERS